MENKEIEGIGLLKYHHESYMGEINVRIFGMEYTIRIRFMVYDKGEQGVTEPMIRAALNVLNVLKEKGDEIQFEIKNYYDLEVKELADDDKCDYFVFNDTAQLKEVMVPQELYITDLQRNGNIEDIKVGLFFMCNWDEDEGFGIRFNGNGIIKKVGSGSVVY